MNNPITPGFVYTWGTGEELKCVKGISYFNILNDNDAEVKSCYAAVIATKNAIIPYSVNVDRYVIAEVNSEVNDAGGTYYELDPSWKAELQSQGWLPHQLPIYIIGIDSYLPSIGLISLFLAWFAWQIYRHTKATDSDAQPSEQSVVRTSEFAEKSGSDVSQSILDGLDDEQRKANQSVDRLQRGDRG